MSQVLVQAQLAAAVVDGATFTASYPERPAPDAGVYNAGDFASAVAHKLVVNQQTLTYPDDFDVTFGTANITVTNKTGSTWGAGSNVILELQLPGKPVYRTDAGAKSRIMPRVARSDTFIINLGAPDALDADGICESQNIDAAGDLELDGALVNDFGVAVLDVPRNIIIDSGDADDAVLTIYGTDEYGNDMVEALTLNGTTAVAGKKAFKTVNRIHASKAIANGAFVGTGDVLGLPVFLPGKGHLIAELEDGSAATPGVVVAGVSTAGGATATSGDVRGTYDPNSACDGSKSFSLIVSLPDATYLGQPQYAG